MNWNPMNDRTSAVRTSTTARQAIQSRRVLARCALSLSRRTVSAAKPMKERRIAAAVAVTVAGRRTAERQWVRHGRESINAARFSHNGVCEV